MSTFSSVVRKPEEGETTAPAPEMEMEEPVREVALEVASVARSTAASSAEESARFNDLAV